MTRIPAIISPEGLSATQREIFERIADGARGGVRGPHTVLINNPALASHVERLGVYVRYECRVPERLRELAILLVAFRWKADYEWFAHARLAQAQGYSCEVLEAIGRGEEYTFADSADAAVCAYVKQLLDEGRIDDATYRAAETHLGPNGLLDLTGLVGYYTLLAFTLNAFEVAPPETSGIPWR